MGKTDQHENSVKVEEIWRTYMTTGNVPEYVNRLWYESKILRPLVRMLPTDPRCRVCYYPFRGVGGKLSRIILGIAPSDLNPQLCNICERFANKYYGGAEVELTMLFADVRGSTTMAENMRPAEFSNLIDRFYKAATKVLFQKNAFVEKIIGDEVTAFFVPGFAGDMHTRVAVEAGEEILRATGHDNKNGPWIPVGVGVHTGIAFVGTVSSEGGSTDITVLGDTVNVAARIASQAKTGEVIVSETTMNASGLNYKALKSLRLELKGKKEPIDVRVKTVGTKDSDG